MSETVDFSSDSIVDTPVTDEMRQSFLEYSMSVIVSRALPDVRDGLKPVHRRILYAMWESGFRSDRPYRKCAATIGDTMRKYHPHGDSAIYDTLVRMAQPWALRVPLVDGHGNFGSLDDGAAAYRYTESRLAKAAEALLADVDEDTVDLVDNFDGSEQEPSVLPAAFPNLLVNGSAGIAVGMATNIPPHNLEEVTRAAVHLLENPEATLDDLMAFIPGPDFPSGGTVIGLDAVKEAYRTGRGTFKIRATASIEDITARKKGVIVSELPYMVGPERVMAKIKELTNAKRLLGISDVKDLSGRKHGTRLVIECKTGFNPQAILGELYRLTPLEESFGVNSLALVDGQPRTLPLRDLLFWYLEHRMEIVRRRTRHRLRKAELREHILEGLLVALNAIDEVVAAIRASRTSETAKKKLQKQFKLSEIQATHILEMPLRRLTSLEVTKLKDELAELKAAIKDLKAILASEKKQKEVVTFELERAAAAYGDARRSVLLDQAPSGDIPLEVEDEPCIVSLDLAGLVGRTTIKDTDGKKKRTKTKKSDLVQASVNTSMRSTVYGVTDKGRVVSVDCLAFPDTTSTGRSKPKGGKVGEYFAVDQDENIVGLFSENPQDMDSMLLVTRNGVLKRLDPDGWVKKDGQEIIGLKDDDRVVKAVWLNEAACDVIMISDSAQLLRTDVTSARKQGRTAGGVAGMRLKDGSKIIAAGIMPQDSQDTLQDVTVTTVTDSEDNTNNSVKRSSASVYPAKGRGGGGVRCHSLLKGETGLKAGWVGVGDVFLSGGSDVQAVPDSLVKRDASGDKVEFRVENLAVKLSG